MNILLTGGAGYIGSVVVQELLKHNFNVIIIDNLQEGNIEAVLPDAIFFQGDFSDEDLLVKIFKQYKKNCEKIP